MTAQKTSEYGTKDRPRPESSSRPSDTKHSAPLNATHMFSHSVTPPSQDKQRVTGVAAGSSVTLLQRLFEASKTQREMSEKGDTKRDTKRDANGRGNTGGTTNTRVNTPSTASKVNTTSSPLATEKRTRKASAPAPAPTQRPIKSSENYAGAAFDRAPSGTSFPIPSFVQKPSSAEMDGGRAVVPLPASCPPLLGPLSAKVTAEEANALTRKTAGPVMRSVSISDLLGSRANSQPASTTTSLRPTPTKSAKPVKPVKASLSPTKTSPSPPTNAIAVTSSGRKNHNDANTDVNVLTRDLCRMLKVQPSRDSNLY